MEVNNIILDELREFRREQAKINTIVIRNEERIQKIIEERDNEDKRKWRTPIVITCVVSILTGINMAIKLWP